MKNLKQLLNVVQIKHVVKYATALIIVVLFTNNAKAQMNGDTSPAVGTSVTYYADYAFTHELDTPCYDVYWSADSPYTVIDQGFDMQYGDYITIQWTYTGTHTIYASTNYVNTSEVPDGNPDNIRLYWDYEDLAVTVTP